MLTRPFTPISEPRRGQAVVCPHCGWRLFIKQPEPPGTRTTDGTRYADDLDPYDGVPADTREMTGREGVNG